MWVAARTGGFHYRFDGERWVDTRGGPDMAEALSQICTDANGGQPLKVTI
ncbi:MAG: iron donor protein CyaY, partial [Alcaligenaceae bacterium]|nr:iron donor protein CyaY [Alcaligenaceae bacterium]